MELFYHNNLYLVSIYYIGEIEIISRNLSIKCINKLRPFFLYRKRLPGQYTAPRIGFSQTPYHSSRPMCTTEGTLAVWALKLAPSHHPCMTYSLFSSRPHLPFKYFFRDKFKPKHSIMEGLSPPFLWNLAQNSPESGEYRICVSVLLLHVAWRQNWVPRALSWIVQRELELNKWLWKL